MCCFSQPVEAVSHTSIFARSQTGMQYLIYSMTLDTAVPVAMILPLPVALPASAGTLEFIDLSRYPTLFADLRRCFPEPLARGAPMPAAAPADAWLRVERVGAFDASFVPTMADFARLDPRFRLDREIWAAWPEYADYGFAVFQLAAGKARIHPMALRFRSRSNDLYFPTVHVHAGRVEPRAHFDHALYAQAVDATAQGWEQGSVPPAAVMDLGSAHVGDHSAGTVLPNDPVWRLELSGMRANADIWLRC